jgi:DNA sulfur modification protein DndB
MKIPAIRAKMGNWTYYVSTLSFQQVNDHVSKVDEELHRSESLKELIQRSITQNYLSIKNYILNQPELFFNSLVLAVYNDYPDWKEIEVKYDDEETFQLGLLEFPGKHKIFPVDGQHRVEGIKAALADRPELADTKIGALFIGHSNDLLGMERTRRLFSTLNRYAKPVTMDDIIALDEDDSIAIVTRNLLEGHSLFTGKKVTKSKNKAIPTDDKNSFTSIITLYDCNWEILKMFRRFIKQKEPNPERDNKPMAEYLDLAKKI